MGSGNSRFFKNTSGANMPRLSGFVGGDIETRSELYYIIQFVKGLIKWRELKLILNEKDDVLRKSRYGINITVDSLDLINQIKLFEVGRNKVEDLLIWVSVIINSDIFCYVKNEELELKGCMHAILSAKEVDNIFLRNILRRLKEL